MTALKVVHPLEMAIRTSLVACSHGRLSGQRVSETHAGHRVEVESDKRDPADFALWKRAGDHPLMKWPSPWVDGFPGSHIECSGMSLKHLGERFDIHTGGIDLKFPHHEDEIAQSNGALGHRVVSVWMHGEFPHHGRCEDGEEHRKTSSASPIRLPESTTGVPESRWPDGGYPGLWKDSVASRQPLQSGPVLTRVL